MSYVDTSAFLGGVAIFSIIFMFIFVMVILACLIIYVIGLWKTFKKAGKKGWEAIVPFYNQWVLVEISGCKWWFFLVILFSSMGTYRYSFNLSDNITLNLGFFDSILSLANLFAMYLVNYNIAKKFNKDYLYAIGLTFLPFIFYPMLGLGKTKYNEVNVSPYGIFKEGDKK